MKFRFDGWMSVPRMAALFCFACLPLCSELKGQSDADLFGDRNLVDLSHTFDKATIYWPTERGFQLIRGPAGVTEGGYYYSANRFAAAEHGGTHVDAPIHFYADRESVDQIPIRRLMGAAAVVDVSRQCEADPDYQISVADLRAWETKHERQLVDVVVLLRTGFGRYWPLRKRYLGTDRLGAEAVNELHFPGLDPQAARWLVENRSIKSIGIDTASIDHGQSHDFGSHVILCERNIPAFENVANLETLPSWGAAVIGLPMKIGAGSGAPVRMVGLVPRE